MRNESVDNNSNKVNIFVCGDVEGNVIKLYKKITKILKTGKAFEVLLCVGDFFGPDSQQWLQYKNGQLKAPIQTLILGPCKPELCLYFSNHGGDLCENITYLGHHGHYSMSCGLHITYLSGMDGGSNGGPALFSSKDVADLLSSVTQSSGYRGTDIFLTSQWPSRVDNYGSKPDVDIRKDSQLVAKAARALRPRYHFAGVEGIFYERQPYRNHRMYQESQQHVTRFIALAKFGTEGHQSKGGDGVEGGEQFFFDMNGGRKSLRKHRVDGGGGSHHQPKRERVAGKEGVMADCWFCLGSAQVEKHLVVSIVSEVYLALAKGGLVPDHTLILPISHHPSQMLSPEPVLSQIDRYKSSLRNCFKAEEKAVVFYERNYKSSHLQIQAVPIPYSCVRDVRETFMDCAESAGIELLEIPKHSDLKQIITGGCPYFYAELPTGHRLLHRIKGAFPLHFGRDVLSEPAILNTPERVDWKSCKLDKETETEHAGTFRAKFQPFDFSFE